MEYYSSSSSSRGRSSYRGSSYRSRGDTYRGSRGSRGGTSRGRGGSSYSSKYDSPSTKYSSSLEGSKYGSSSYSKYDDSYRRPDSAMVRDHRTDLNESRKRERPDSYSSSQGVTRRHDDEEYRSSRYSGSSYTEHRSYEEPRVFKKPRSEFKSPSEYRVKEPLRLRTPRGRIGLRGGVARRGAREPFSRRRTAFSSPCASPSEILAIRRAKLLQNRKAKSTEKIEKKEEGEVEGSPKPEAKTTSENGEAKPEEEPKEELARTTFYGRPFMKLVCPHCDIKCVTFKEYNAHFNHSVHINAIKDKCTSLKTELAAMRLSQRESQKKADEEDLTSMNTRSLFCSICKLHFSQERATHQVSELHKKLKEFLMPYCKICRIQFDSPMAHESHLCSLEHLRRKHSVEEREKRSTSGILDNFMVLDSVGSGDEIEDDEVGGTSVERGEDLTLGVEFIRIYNVMYCGVCRVYLSHLEAQGASLKQHCQTKEHLKFYLRYGNEDLTEKLTNDGSKPVPTPTPEEKLLDTTKKEDSEEILEGDKLWDGLSELLGDAQPRIKSDDEDEEEGGRFDRFKSKEQKENGDLPVEESKEKENTSTEEVPTAVAAET